MSKFADQMRRQSRGGGIEPEHTIMQHAADLLDEAEKALAELAPIADIFDKSAGNRPKTGEICSWEDHRVGERVLTVEALRNARATLARIRGEQS